MLLLLFKSRLLRVEERSIRILILIVSYLPNDPGDIFYIILEYKVNVEENCVI